MPPRRPPATVAPSPARPRLAASGAAGAVAGPEVDLPVLPLRGEILFPIPDALSPFLVGRERSVSAIEHALAANRRILVVAQRNPEREDVVFDELHEVGTEGTIVRMLKLPDGTTSVLVEGLQRMRLVELVAANPYLRVRGQLLEDLNEDPPAALAAMPGVLALYQKVVELSASMSEDNYVRAMNAETPGLLADMVAATLQLTAQSHQDLLETRDVSERMARVRAFLEHEIEVLSLEQEIRDSVRASVTSDQREFFLREQLKAITKELGDSITQNAELAKMRSRLSTRAYPPAVRERGLKELDRLNALPPGSPEISVVRTYLEWLVELPWKVATRDKTDVARAEAILNDHHFGLPKVKERLLEHIAVRQLVRRPRSPILCFVGPPGVGKTSLGRSIAAALDRKFVRVSLGGVRDEAEIRGHRMTYIGSMPGRVLQKMREAGTVNPVYMIDEIDKLGLDYRGDPAAALLEVLDPEQNYTFSDHYLELPYDLSRVLFIATANTLDGLPPALVDRMEVLEIPGYVEDEKLEIATRFLIPRQLTQHGIPVDTMTFTTGALQHMVRAYTREAGVRELERMLATIARKRALARAEGDTRSATIGEAELAAYLGPRRYRSGEAEEADSIAAATAVFGTPAGGELLPVEVVISPGGGDVTLTGKLGEVIQESAHAALSYARANAAQHGFGGTDFAKIDIHVHVPSGALPKDGPSAGIAIATALVSALAQRKVRRDVTMTGEITLRGRVLRVGGIKEKVLAAHRAGLRTFVLPANNRQDLDEIPERVKRDLNFVLATTMAEVLTHAFVPVA
ncbi:MAG: endopeptidase La [Actinobacteria bacterium]|nr:endopeptidase La [Actinomycetota bacterium]